MSVPLALEYEAVCQRPEQRLATGLSQKEVSAFVNTLIDIAEPAKHALSGDHNSVIPTTKWFLRQR
jgi:hypothetical protein